MSSSPKQVAGPEQARGHTWRRSPGSLVLGASLAWMRVTDQNEKITEVFALLVSLVMGLADLRVHCQPKTIYCN